MVFKSHLLPFTAQIVKYLLNDTAVAECEQEGAAAVADAAVVVLEAFPCRRSFSCGGTANSTSYP